MKTTFATALLCVAVMGVDVTRKTLQFESFYSPRVYTPKISMELPQYEPEASDSDDGEITFKRCEDGTISTFCKDDIAVKYDRDEARGSDYHKQIPGDYEAPVAGDYKWTGRVYDSPRFSRTARGNTAADVTKW